MLLGLIDLPAASAGARPLSFSEPASLEAMDLVVWAPAAIASLYGNPGGQRGAEPLPVEAAQRLVRDTRAWREEFRAFLARGASLVVLAPALPAIALHTPQDIVDYDLLEALPEDLRVAREPIAPGAVHCGVGEPFRSLFAAIGGLLEARSALSLSNSQPIASSGTAVCGVYRYVHPGRVMVLPSLAPSASARDKDRLVEAVVRTVAGLRRAAGQTRSAASDALAPSAQEADLAAQLEAIAAQGRLLRQQELALRTRLQRLAELRALLLEDGDAALEAAGIALESLGASVQHELARSEGFVFEAEGLRGLLVVAGREEDTAAVAARLEAVLEARSREIGQALRLVVLTPGAGAQDTRSGTAWRCVSGRELLDASIARRREFLAFLLA